MSVETFIEKLQEGDFTSATDVLKDVLKESSVKKIQERKQHILESTGFIISEEEEMDDDDMDDKDEEDKDDDEKDED